MPANENEPSVALIAAADEGYLHLLDGLLASLEAARLPSRFHRCLFDLGLSETSSAALGQRVDRMVAADWGLNFARRGEAPLWFRAMINPDLIGVVCGAKWFWELAFATALSSSVLPEPINKLAPTITFALGLCGLAAYTAILRARAIRPGHCECGYNLQGSTNRCLKCGRFVSPQPLSVRGDW
jgi:hypothetical protein